MNTAIAMFLPSSTDATSFYRAMGPFGQLKRKHDITLTFFDNVNWATLSLVDIVFLQRPYTNVHLAVAQLSKLSGTPLWVDIDDDLFSVPYSNPAFRIYSKKETVENVKSVLAMADVVTVTTEHLKERYSQFNKNVIVIPNALDDRFATQRSVIKPKRNKLINWRGSATHDEDLYSVTREIIDVCDANPTWTWNFIGEPFWLTVQALPNEKSTICEMVDVNDYFQLISNIAPAIQIVPLIDTQFNRSKSNIAWLEGAYSGAVTLAPDWPQWRKPGVVTYNGPEDFKRKLQGLITTFDSNPEPMDRLLDEAWDYILKNCLVSKVNEERVNVIKSLSTKI